MAADSGEDKKPPRTKKAAPAKRASGAAKKPAKTAAKKPAKAPSAAARKTAAAASAGPKKTGKVTSAPRRKSASASASAKPAKAASAAAKKPARKPATVKKTTKASPTAKKPARSAPAAKPPVVAQSTPAAEPSPAATPPIVAQSTPSAKPAPSAAPSTPTREADKSATVAETARAYFDALAARDVAAATGVWSDEGVNDIVPLRILRGSAAIRSFLGEMFAAMPDARFTTERIIADGEAASVQWRLTGTFSGEPFQGLEPTGRRVDLRGNDLLEIEDGKIVRNTGIFDGAAYARQVGLLPPEDSGADRAIRAGFNTVTKLRRTVAKRTAR